MIVINSGAYVSSEFRAEFGAVPPCLLPLGNRKLIEFQVANLRETFDEDIVVSLPDDYQLGPDDEALLDSLKLEVARVPTGLSLAEALLYVLNVTSAPDGPLRLLHGDTLIGPVDGRADCIGVAVSEDDYDWEAERLDSGQKAIWCGYFSFSSTRDFIRSLAISRGDFVAAVREYGSRVALHNLPIADWHDLGHVNTYFASRTYITTQRSFNDLKIKNGIVRKTSENAEKIIAEYSWFKALPSEIKVYTPALLNDSGASGGADAFYELEYLPLSPLNEILVHGRNPPFFWNRVFRQLARFLEQARTFGDSEQAVQDAQLASDYVFRTKTSERLGQVRDTLNLAQGQSIFYGAHQLPSLDDVVENCLEIIERQAAVPAIMHGDLCFSNILYDSRTAQLKVIDPRGTFAGQRSIYGDQRYDLAKLGHSVIGLYDHIIAGRYRVDTSEGAEVIRFGRDARLKTIQDEFLRAQFIPGQPNANAHAAMVLLFISMIPLHADRPDRQNAMFLNALRLYLEMEEAN